MLADKYGADTLRYYLMSDIVTGQDADFSEERLVERYNTDLANSLGNLLNRTLTMVGRYQDGRIAFSEGAWLRNADECATETYANKIDTHIKAYKEHMSAESTFPIPFTLPFTLGPFVANAAIGNVLGIADEANRRVERIRHLGGSPKVQIRIRKQSLTQSYIHLRKRCASSRF